MPKVTVFDTNGKQVEELELKDDIFGIEVNKYVLHEAVVNYLANQRQGTQSAKTRSEVRGGGAKPYRQKGTGRARQGTIRAPQFVGGGVVFAPKPRNYKYSLNKKVKRLAIKSALSSKVLDNELIVLDNMKYDEIKTKNVVNTLNNLKVDTKALIVMADNDETVQKSARNIPNVKTTSANTINVYDILKYDKLILTKDAVAKIEEVYV